MRRVISISVGTSKRDYEFQTKFLGKEITVKRIGCDGDMDELVERMYDWEGEVDVIGLAGVRFSSEIGLEQKLIRRRAAMLKELSTQLKVPVTTGEMFRHVSQEWAARYIQFKFKDYFTNQKILFMSGLVNYNLANVLATYTDNIVYADPFFDSGIPKFINSMKNLELYGKKIYGLMRMTPTRFFTKNIPAIKELNQQLLRKEIRKSHIIVVPYFSFYRFLEGTTAEDLSGKIVMSATCYDDRVEFLKKRGVTTIIDPTPLILDRVVGVNVLEAIIIDAIGKTGEDLTNDDLLEVISSQKIYPRIIYPSGEVKRMNRFAFVIHPLSQEHIKKLPALKGITDKAPKFALNAIEKVMAYSPPFVYSKVTGIKSPAGAEVEGWLITVGGTPKQMLSHSAEFTYKRLLTAAKMAKRLGAQIMGLGAFTKVVGDAGVTVAKLAPIPITTGNSYSASGAIWAAADAARRMGILKLEKGKIIKGKAMVMGATGAIGAVCARLIALVFEEIYLVDIRDARLLALKESILEENPKVKVHISTRADKWLSDMDVIVTATSAAGKKVLDIMRVKPGTIITDVARPLDLSAEDVAKRPDVLVIESGEIELPGDPKFKDIGLPPKVSYACLAETIVLALEGKFENFTLGREIEWQKVKEIYRLGLKHGMKLASISGVKGIYSDEDIQKVRELALAERKKMSKEQKGEEKATDEKVHEI